MTTDEVKIVDLGKAIERLLEDKDFQNVILDTFIRDQAISIGSNFDGSIDDQDTLKAISCLKAWLSTKVEDAKIVLQSNSK